MRKKNYESTCCRIPFIMVDRLAIETVSFSTCRDVWFDRDELIEDSSLEAPPGFIRNVKITDMAIMTISITMVITAVTIKE